MTSVTRVLGGINRNRVIVVSALLYLPFAYAYMPMGVFPHAFDKNAFPEFMMMILVSAIFGVYILARRNRFIFTGKAVLAMWALLISVGISTLMSSDPIASLTGDSGRYAGVVSLLCLLIIAIYHAQFSEIQIRKLIAGYLLGVIGMEFLGFGQYMHWWSFPTAGGVSGPLGNMDFFDAYVGTAIPLFLYFVWTSTRRGQVLAGLGTVASIYSLVLATRREAWVDVAITIIMLLVYLIRDRFPFRELTLNAKTVLFTIFFIIWIEGVFLMPFLGKSVPLLGNDPQVQIRSHFWVAGILEFLHAPLFGLGPDQYGNYYERFRTIADAKQFPTIISNDAHSATVQTLATLGIAGTALFILLLAVFIRSLLILISRKPEHKKLYLFIGLYGLVFLTNSTVSPITFPNKFIFWAVAGFVVGSAYRQREHEREIEARRNKRALAVLVALGTALSLFVGTKLGIAETQLNIGVEKLVKNGSAHFALHPSSFLPCTFANNSLLAMAQTQGGDAEFAMAKELVAEHTRCVTPRIFLAEQYYYRHDLPSMRAQIIALEGIAPDRNEFLQTALGYAQAAHDSVLTQQIVVQMEKVGILNFTKAAPKSSTSSLATAPTK